MRWLKGDIPFEKRVARNVSNRQILEPTTTNHVARQGRSSQQGFGQLRRSGCSNGWIPFLCAPLTLLVNTSATKANITLPFPVPGPQRREGGIGGIQFQRGAQRGKEGKTEGEVGVCVCSVEWYSLENCRGPIPGERMGRAHRHPIRFAKFRQVYANGD